MKKWLIRSIVGLISLLGGVALMVWLIWIPSAQEPTYRFSHSWGEPGVKPGQFHDPMGIAVSGDEVFVSDARNGRIQVFDYDGQLKRIIGSAGDGPDQLGRPMNLDIFDGSLYVADYWNDRIQVYALDGRHIRSIGSSGSDPGQLSAPGGVVVNELGEIYVAEFYNQRVQHLSAEGEFIKQFGTTGKASWATGQFSYPTDVAIDSSGRLFVADGYNDRVQVFDASGQFLAKWGGPLAMNIFGPFRGWFATVTSVTVGPDDRIFVADFYNNRIQKFSLEGEESRFLSAMGKKGNGTGEFAYAASVAVAPNGMVFATDLRHNRILSFVPAENQAALPEYEK